MESERLEPLLEGLVETLTQTEARFNAIADVLETLNAKQDDLDTQIRDVRHEITRIEIWIENGGCSQFKLPSGTYLPPDAPDDSGKPKRLTKEQQKRKAVGKKAAATRRANQTAQG